MRIVIRADAGSVPEIGTGHVIRTLKLADALRKSPRFQSAEILFATRTHSPFELGGILVDQAGYARITNAALEPNSESELQTLVDARPDITIFDRLETDEGLIANLKRAGVFVATFDDLGSGRRVADLSIHPLLQNVDAAPNTYVGYDYLYSLSDEVSASETAAIALNIFVSFGGFDHRHLNLFFLNLIPQIEGPKRYEIVASGLNRSDLYNLNELARAIGERSRVQVIVHQRPANFFKLLSMSDLAVVSGGLTAFACAQAGIPAIGLPQYEHQLENIERLERLGCLKSGAHKMALDSQFLSTLVSDLSANYLDRHSMSQNGKRVIDGNGLDRTVQLIAQYVERHRFNSKMK